jgi:hypothetical protein
MSVYFYYLRETIYRWLLIAIAKLILAISPILWRIPSRFSFELHQRLGAWVISKHHQYDLNVL